MMFLVGVKTTSFFVMARFRKRELRLILIGICFGLGAALAIVGFRIIYQVKSYSELEKNSSYLFSQILDSSYSSNLSRT